MLHCGHYCYILMCVYGGFKMEMFYRMFDSEMLLVETMMNLAFVVVNVMHYVYIAHKPIRRNTVPF